MSSKPDDDDRQRTQPELPSVIVDPSLLGPSVAAKTGDAPSGATEEESPAPPTAPSRAPRASAEPPTDEDEKLEIAAERLSIQDADRFAASIRPSWEPPAPAPTPRASADAKTHAATATEHEDEPLPTLAVGGRMTKPRALSLTAAAILGFGALVVLAVAGGETEPPESWKTSTAKPPTAAPAAPAAPIAAPAPASVPGPAPMPSAAAAPVAPVQATPTPAATVPAPTAVPEAAPAPAAAPEAAPAPAPVTSEPERVRLRIGTIPRSASLSIDGRPVANPLDASMPSGQEHRVEAKAPGYTSRSVKVTTDQHRTITLELERARPAAKAPTAPAKRPSTAPAKTTTKATTAKKPATAKSAGFVSDSPY